MFKRCVLLNIALVLLAQRPAPQPVTGQQWLNLPEQVKITYTSGFNDGYFFGYSLALRPGAEAFHQCFGDMTLRQISDDTTRLAAFPEWKDKPMAAIMMQAMVTACATKLPPPSKKKQ